MKNKTILAGLLATLLLAFFSCAVFAENKIKNPRPKDITKNFYSVQKKYFDKMRVSEAWKYTKGSPDVLVGIVDLGFDFFHPALKDKLIPGFFASDVYHAELFETIGHGTMVAGLIAAKPVNNNEICGLAPNCKVLTASQGTIENKFLKLLQENSSKITSIKDFIKLIMRKEKEVKDFGMKWQDYVSKTAADSIRYLANNNVKIINISEFLSFNNKVFQKRINDAVQYATKKDVVVVIGAGNNNQKIKYYPGDNDTVLVAGAAMLNDERWTQASKVFGAKIKQGSCYGPRLSVMTPIENLVVCMPHEEKFYSCDDSPVGKTKNKFKGQYAIMPVGATSCAAPIVSSLAALVRSLRPDLFAKDVIKIIKLGTDDIGKKGYDVYTGYGRVNFLKTLEIAKSWKR